MSDTLKGNEQGAALTPQIKSVVEAAENYYAAKAAYVCMVAEFNSDLPKDDKNFRLSIAALLDTERRLYEAVHAHLVVQSKEKL